MNAAPATKPMQSFGFFFSLLQSHENCLVGWRKEGIGVVGLAISFLHVPCSPCHCLVPLPFLHTELSAGARADT